MIRARSQTKKLHFHTFLMELLPMETSKMDMNFLKTETNIKESTSMRCSMEKECSSGWVALNTMANFSRTLNKDLGNGRPLQTIAQGLRCLISGSLNKTKSKAKGSTFTRMERIIKEILKMTWSMGLALCFMKIKRSKARCWEDTGNREILSQTKKGKFTRWKCKKMSSRLRLDFSKWDSV